jgi:anti-sigma factor RsiW
MGHISTSDLIDLADGGGEPARASRLEEHLARCARCARRLDALRSTLVHLSDVPVAEPPAGFWEHLSDRVHDAVAAESSPSDWRGASPFLAWRPALVMAAAILIAVAATAWLVRGRQTDDRAGASAAVLASVPAAGAVPLAVSPRTVESAPLATSDPIDLMAALSANLDWDEVAAAGLAPPPGSAEAALTDLSPAQQRELVELLQQELNQ